MRRLETWVAERLRPAILQGSDAEGFARDSAWSPGGRDGALPEPLLRRIRSTTTLNPTSRTQALCAKAGDGEALDESEIAELFAARGDDFVAVLSAADALRFEVNGDEGTYVVTRNINYTNVCYFKCQFCAFSKGKLSENLRGAPYDLDLDEIARRSVAPPKCACKGASIPSTLAPPIWTSAEPSRRPYRECMCMPFRRWRRGKALRPSTCRWRSSSGS